MNDNPNIQESESQCKRILAYLLNGSRITSLEALRLFGCMRLASRISDLRKSHITSRVFSKHSIQRK